MDADFKQSSSSVNHHYFDLPVRDLIKTQNSKKVNLVLSVPFGFSLFQVNIQVYHHV